MSEYAFKTSRYRAGLVPWSLNELLGINAMWSRAYNRFWWRRESAHGIDAWPVLVASTDGGRDRLSAIEEWTREVLTLYDQCLFPPGDQALNQRKLPRLCYTVYVKPFSIMTALPCHGYSKCCASMVRQHSVLELFLQRLDKQGLKISSPWEPVPGRLMYALVPILWGLAQGHSKEEWAGFIE